MVNVDDTRLRGIATKSSLWSIERLSGQTLQARPLGSACKLKEIKPEKIT